MSIDEGVNKLYVGRKVVIVIEFTPPRERERERARSKIGLCSGISMVQVSPTFCQRISIWILCLDFLVFVH